VSATLRGSLLATLALAAVGSLVAASDAVESYPLAEGQFMRYLLAAAILVAVARGRLPRLSAREALGLVALAATGLVLFNVFVVEGVRETDPATVGVIVGCVPVVLALAAPLLERRPLSGRVLVAGVVVSVGAAGVQWADGGITWLGLGLALGALACEAAFSLLAAPHLERLGPLAVSAYACLFALPLLAGWGIVAGGPELPAPTAEELAALVHHGRVPVLVHGRRHPRSRARGTLRRRAAGERARLLGSARRRWGDPRALACRDRRGGGHHAWCTGGQNAGCWRPLCLAQGAARCQSLGP
jgi:drug/metabolite transporter (DMT)-like permease